MKAPSASDTFAAEERHPDARERSTQQDAARAAMRSQAGAIAQARSLGGTVSFRYKILVNAFSAKLSPQAAAIAQRADVRSVQPVSIVKMDLTTSVPFIGAPQVWANYGVRGQGMRVAVVDTGIDYTRLVRRSRDGGGVRRQRPDVHRGGHVPDAQGDRRLRLRR